MDVANIKEHVTPLVIPKADEELAKRFDYLMYTIQLAELTGGQANQAKDKVVKTAQALNKLGTMIMW